MVFFLKYFKRDPSHALEKFYQHAGLNSDCWVSVVVNKNNFANSLLTREIELKSPEETLHLKLGISKNKIISKFWDNNVSENKGSFVLNSPANLRFNDFIDQLLENKIKHYQHLLAHLDQRNFSANEVATEDKALEWMRVSFSLLEKAIVQSLTDSELLFQAMLFIGKNPKTNLEEIRLICFNLDIKFEILPNHLLRVRIYNDKNEEFGSAKKASLEGDFNLRKREMLDQLTHLLSIAGQGIKIT